MDSKRDRDVGSDRYTGADITVTGNQTVPVNPNVINTRPWAATGTVTETNKVTDIVNGPETGSGTVSVKANADAINTLILTVTGTWTETMIARVTVHANANATYTKPRSMKVTNTATVNDT